MLRKSSTKKLDRWFWLALLVSALVVLPRCAAIASVSSQCWDDQYHLLRGLLVLTQRHPQILYNDPPLGETIISLPMFFVGCRPHLLPTGGFDKAVLFHQPLKPETLLFITALWKGLLFLPFAALVFHWCRRLYGLGGAWLGLTLVLIEPTIAAHTAVAALDVLAMEGIVLACYLAWRYFQEPSKARLIAAGVAVGAVPLLKHTAALIPLVLLLFAGVWWIVFDRKRDSLRSRVNALAAMVLVAAVSLWAFTGFDISEPRNVGRMFRAEYTQAFSFKADVLNGLMMRPQPAGIYFGSLAEAVNHGIDGDAAYLLGQSAGPGGFWYYFPVLATYKIPLGIAAVLLLALISLRWKPLQRDEWALLIPFLAWGFYIAWSGINMGFRHALPSYIFLLMFAARAVSLSSVVAWTGAALAAVHVLSWHPNYLPYVNYPRPHAYRDIADSNIDWGQSLRQAHRWIDQHAPSDVPIFICYYGDLSGDPVHYYLGNRVRFLPRTGPLPHDGLLIMTPHWEAVDPKTWGSLYRLKPAAIIGQCLRVYDLSQLREFNPDSHELPLKPGI